MRRCSPRAKVSCLSARERERVSSVLPGAGAAAGYDPNFCIRVVRVSL